MSQETRQKAIQARKAVMDHGSDHVSASVDSDTAHVMDEARLALAGTLDVVIRVLGTDEQRQRIHAILETSETVPAAPGTPGDSPSWQSHPRTEPETPAVGGPDSRAHERPGVSGEVSSPAWQDREVRRQAALDRYARGESLSREEFMAKAWGRAVSGRGGGGDDAIVRRYRAWNDNPNDKREQESVLRDCLRQAREEERREGDRLRDQAIDGLRVHHAEQIERAVAAERADWEKRLDHEIDARKALQEAFRKARVEALRWVADHVNMNATAQAYVRGQADRLERDQPAAPISAKCEKCGYIGGAVTDGLCVNCWSNGFVPKAKPSPTTDAPETNRPDVIYLRPYYRDGCPERYIEDAEATRRGNVPPNEDGQTFAVVPLDVVEKRVAEERHATFSATRGILDAAPDESLVNAARRVVAERDTAIARVRELESQRNELLATKEEHRERAETAERELAEQKQAAITWNIEAGEEKKRAESAERERDDAMAKAALWDQVADAVRGGMGWEIKP